MNKVYPYVILHLNHRQLIALEREVRVGNGSEEEALAVEKYRDLMSNRPRFDPSIRNTFGSRSHTMEESIIDLKRDQEAINAQKIARKIASAKFLNKAGYYIKVAEVDAVMAQDAVRFTTSINELWMLSNNKNVIPTEDAWRSTDSYDLIQRFSENFLKMPLGYIDMQAESYARELV